MPHIFDNTLRETIQQRLARFSQTQCPPTPEAEGLKQAAVAIVIAPRMQEAGFLLTRRASRLGSHASQWALPGGRLDAGETIIEAARRELEEEVNLRLGDSEILGVLDEYPTRSGYRITPVVFWAEDMNGLKVNPDEVASIHNFSLSELQRKGSPMFLTIPESSQPVIRLLLGNNWRVHAPTGAVLYQFSEVALSDRATRVAHLEQPVFAWK